MSWAKKDDEAWHNEKLISLSHEAYRLDDVSISFVASEWPAGEGCLTRTRAETLARMHRIADPAAAVAELLAKRRWEKRAHGLMHIHHIEQYMPPAALSRARAVAGQLGGNAKRDNRERVSKPVASAKQSSSSGSPVPEPVPVPVPSRSPNGDSSHSLKRDDVQAVWDAWTKATGRTRSSLDEKRRKLIVGRLREFPVADLVAAVTGWKHDPWPDRARQNGIEILLRDAAHVEKFRDLEIGHRPAVEAPRDSMSTRQREATDRLAAQLRADTRAREEAL